MLRKMPLQKTLRKILHEAGFNAKSNVLYQKKQALDNSIFALILGTLGAFWYFPIDEISLVTPHCFH
jgi:hypothetical protein